MSTTLDHPHARRAATDRGTVSEQMEYAKALACSSMLPQEYQNKPANVLWAMGYAEMLAMHPMAVMTGMHNMQGKPTASAAFIGMLVRRAGHRLDVFMEGETAVAELTRADAPDRTFRVEWTMERAHNAKITNKTTWRHFWQSMLKARATTEVSRDNAADALFGILYTPEELGADSTNEDGIPDTTAAPAPAESTEKHATVHGGAIASEQTPAEPHPEPDSDSEQPDSASTCSAGDTDYSNAVACIDDDSDFSALFDAAANAGPHHLTALGHAISDRYGKDHAWTCRLREAVAPN